MTREVASPPRGPVVAAVDFGASSLRVCRVDLGARPVELEVVHRYRHGPVPDSHGHLRWDWDRLVEEMVAGLVEARQRGPLASIGVDTWAVDYGLLDRHGELVAPPYSYRDRRTDGYRTVVDRVGEAALYSLTGTQLQPFNTLFQLAVHDRAELDEARQLLLLPELLVYHLTGEILGERTSAGSTALVDITTGEWSGALAELAGIDQSLLPPIRPATTLAGTWEGVAVHLVGGHDTASAVAAMAPSPARSAAFVSSGTWLLVGREQSEPDLSETARRANFTNEAGALDGIRFLKNLAGWWLLDGCRPAWGDPSMDDLLCAAAATEPGPCLDVTDPRFLHPDDMLREVTTAAGLDQAASPPTVVRCILDSMAAGTAAVIDSLGGITEVNVFGGGAQAALYRRLVAERTGLDVVSGPVEATALGNALVQGVALGAFDDLAEARSRLAEEVER